jgi:uncharacterized protein (TIGR02271 family)
MAGYRGFKMFARLRSAPAAPVQPTNLKPPAGPIIFELNIHRSSENGDQKFGLLSVAWSNGSKQREVMKDKDPEARQITLPLYEEAVTVSKRVVPKNRVRVSTVTHQRRQLVDELLQRESVEIGRISIGRPIEAVPAVREEDDTIIIPVVEEVLTLQRTLILREEVRIRKVRTEEHFQESVTLRSQQAGVTRLPVEEHTAAESAAVGLIELKEELK